MRQRVLERRRGLGQVGTRSGRRVAGEHEAEQRLLGMTLRQHALAPRHVDDVQRGDQACGLELTRELLGAPQELAGGPVECVETVDARRRREQRLRVGPMAGHRVEQVAERGLREALRERGDVGVDLSDGVVDLGRRRGVAAIEQAQRARLHEPLREHAQLAGAVDGVGIVRRGDHLLRHLADAPVAVHRRGAQHGEGFLLRDLSGAHQDALGAVDQLSLVEAAGDVGELGAHLRLVREARLGDADHAAQPVGAVAVDDVGVDAGAHRALDLGGVGVVGEQHDRARRGRGEQREAGEQLLVGRDVVAHDDVGRRERGLSHQVAPRGAADDADAGGREVGVEVDGGGRRAVDDQRGRHGAARLRGRARRSMTKTMQGAHHGARDGVTGMATEGRT